MIPLSAIALMLMQFNSSVPKLPLATIDTSVIVAQERLGNISRAVLSRIHELSGGLTEHGYLIRPILMTDLYPAFTRGDGVYEQPMAWDPRNSIVFEVKDSYMIRLDYQLDARG